MKDFDPAYSNDVMGTIGTLQLIEFALKMYITVSHQLIHNKIEGKIPYHFSGKDVENAPLERLLAVFSKLNDNRDLQDRLNKLKESRNHVAHQGFILQFEQVSELLGFNHDIDAQAERISTIKAEARECLADLTQEMRRMAEKYQKSLA